MRFARFVVFFSMLLTLLFLSSCVDKDQGGELASLKIACLGDSITYGYKLADPSRESYPARLGQQAQGRWQVVNCGVNGATVLNKGDIPITSQQAYQRALSSEPDVVVVMLGTNDTKNVNWTHIDEFVVDYTALIRKLQRLPSRPRVIVCSIPPVFADYPNGITARHEEKINDLVQQVVAETGVDFLDIYTPMANTPSLFVDSIHPNAGGAEVIASRVFSEITGR